MFNDGQTIEAYLDRKAREIDKGYNGNGGGTPLAMAVQLLPTPNAVDGKRGADPRGPRRDGGGCGPDLRTVVTELLPTPTASRGERRTRSISSPEAAARRHHDQGRRNIEDAIALLPTPAARDVKGLSARKPRTLADGTASAGDAARNNQLPDAVALLPTPRATDGEKGGPNQRGSSGDLMLPSAVMQMGSRLLPTPTVGDSAGARNSTANRSDPDSGHHSGTTLSDWAREHGATTGQPSTDGSASSAGEHPPRLF